MSHKAQNHKTAPCTPSPSLPAALRIPLSHPSAFETIAKLLTDRERNRSRIAQHLAYAQMQRRQQRSYQGEDEDGSSGEGDVVEGSMFSMSAGLSQKNKDKNRYRDIICYNPTRVLLTPGRDRNGGAASVDADTLADRGYVNASLIQEPDLGLLPPTGGTRYRRRWWVAAQAPIQNTLHAFISMLLTPPVSLESTRNATAPLPRIKTIVQLTPLIEQRRQKCHPYFPNKIGETWFLNPDGDQNEGEGPDDVWVRLDSKVKRQDGSRESELRVGRRGQRQAEGHRVRHLEYRGWSDHGSPEDSEHLIKFIRSTFEINDSSTSTNGDDEDVAPIMVHCSAGVGRTGTYITLASLLPFLENSFQASPSASNSTSSSSRQHPLGSAYPIPPSVKGLDRDYVGETIDHLRDQRCTMVQTVAQVKFCYNALAKEWSVLHP
ncbi:BQ2448_6588 [Microbotryum intermedium]|uniref:BQ2448_6588 protein n=1 Tax=Microbotryum intermedium TaxID=269621 RepID=A0A238FSR9_9BASI|nr:BQ2448_6588 [Microbotryum intermedium]